LATERRGDARLPARRDDAAAMHPSQRLTTDRASATASLSRVGTSPSTITPRAGRGSRPHIRYGMTERARRPPQLAQYLVVTVHGASCESASLSVRRSHAPRKGPRSPSIIGGPQPNEMTQVTIDPGRWRFGFHD
jgi:hypothetical protein